MERRFNDQLREHENNPRAHSAERHEFIDRTLVPWQLGLDRELREHKADLNAHPLAGQEERDQLKTLWEERLTMKGEMRVLRWMIVGGFSVLTIVISLAQLIK